MLSALALCLGMTFEGSRAAFKTFPQNEISLRKSEFEFQCSTDSSEPLSWSVTYAYSNASIKLFACGNLTSTGNNSEYRIDRSIHGQCNLIISVVTFYHAGKYKCSEGSLDSEVEAELAVIQYRPSCLGQEVIKVAETEQVHLECKLWFAGNIDFLTEWYRNGSVVETEMVDTVIGLQRHSTLINSTLRQQVNSTDNGTDFTFKTTFRQRNNSREITVIRNFTVIVFYGPRSIKIEPKSYTYKVGDSLVCWADGNPTPRYKWTHIGNESLAKRTFDGPILIIREAMISDVQHNFQCTARNYVNGEVKNISESIAFTVTETSENRENIPEIRNTQCTPHETSRVPEPSQLKTGIEQSLIDESNYTTLMDNQEHIYSNEIAHTDYYANQRDIELEQQSPEYSNIESIDQCSVNLCDEDTVHTNAAQL